MKKSLSFLLAATLLFSCAACGRAGASAELPAVQKPLESTAAASPPPAAAVDASAAGKGKDAWVSELYSEDGIAASGGLTYDYSYHIPQIEDETPDAAYINEEIAAMFGALAKQGLECVQTKEVPEYLSVTYESYLNGPVLSLLMQYTSSFGQIQQYDAYNYDVEKGSYLPNKQLFARQGLTEEQYLRAVRRATAARYDNIVYDPAFDPDYYGDIPLGDLNQLRAETLSPDTITPNLPTFLDENGKLHAVVTISATGAASHLNDILPLEVQPAAPLQASYADCLSAALRDGVLTLTFTDTPQLQRLLSAAGLERALPYGTEIAVHGAYSDYIDMAFLSSSEKVLPVLFLLTRDGRVEYLPLEKDIAADYYGVIGPLLYLNDVASFDAGPAPTGDDTYFAVLTNGERIDLQMELMREGSSFNTNFLADWSSVDFFPTDGGGSYESFTSFTIRDWYDVQLTSSFLEGEITLVSTGSLDYLGISEDGLVYACTLTEQDGSDTQSTIALRNVRIPEGTEQDPYAYKNTLVVTEISGGFIDMQPGVTTTFVEGAG